MADTIANVLSKGEVDSGHRSHERADKLLASLKDALKMKAAPSTIDSLLKEFISQVVLGAAWYQRKYKNASWQVSAYIILNVLVIVLLPVALICLPMVPELLGIKGVKIELTGQITGQVTTVLTGILALQKTLSAWYAQQRRYAVWYKAAADLKTVYYDFIQVWAGNADPADLAFQGALRSQTSAARKIMQAEQLDFYQKLALPTFDILDMLTGNTSKVATLVGSLLPPAKTGDSKTTPPAGTAK